MLFYVVFLLLNLTFCSGGNWFDGEFGDPNQRMQKFGVRRKQSNQETQTASDGQYDYQYRQRNTCPWTECEKMHIVYVLGLSDKMSPASFKQTKLYLNKTISKCKGEYSIATPSTISDGNELQWCSTNKSCHEVLNELNYEDVVIISKDDLGSAAEPEPESKEEAHPEDLNSYDTPWVYNCPGLHCPDNCTMTLRRMLLSGSNNILIQLHNKVKLDEKEGVLVAVVTDCITEMSLLHGVYGQHEATNYEIRVALIGKRYKDWEDEFDGLPMIVVKNHTGLVEKVDPKNFMVPCKHIEKPRPYPYGPYPYPEPEPEPEKNEEISSTTPQLPTGNSALLAMYIVIPLAVTVIVLSVLAYFYQRNKWQWKSKIARLRYKQDDSTASPTVTPRYTDFALQDKTDQWELPRNRVSIHYEQKLGAGAFSTVYKGYLIGEAPVNCIQNRSTLIRGRIADCDVAIKLLPEYADAMAKSDFVQEINFMKDLGYHPHLVSLLGCVIVDQPLCLITEYCEHGDLLHYVRYRKDEILQAIENDENLRFKDLLSLCWQVSDGMVFLSSKGCIHRDVAARNALVNGQKTAKIGDFGLCRLIDRSIYTTRGGRLPIKWMALESLRFYEYSSMSDVWSFGILLFEVFSLGEVPYPTYQPADMVKMLTTGHRMDKPDHCPDEIYEIMRSCWRENPHSRPTFEGICESLVNILENASKHYGYVDPVAFSDYYAHLNPTED